MFQKISALIFILALALDFKSEQYGGTIWQYGVASVATFVVALNAIMLLDTWSILLAWARRAIVLGGLLLFVSIWVAYFHQVPWENYGRMVFPVFLLWGGFVIAVGVLQTPSDVTWLSKVIMSSAVVNAIWAVYIALFVKELDMGTIRFQISSTGLDILFAYSIARLIANRKLSWLFIGVLFAIFTVQALTITRTYVLIWMVILGFAVCLAAKLRRLQLIPPIPVAGAMATTMAFSIGAIVVLSVLESRYETLTRWNERIWNKAQDRAIVDVSFALRVAQDRGMLLQLCEQPTDFLLGRGFGSSYDLDRQYFFSNVSTDLYKERERLDGTFIGLWQKPDSTWVPIVHSGGAFFLIMVLVFYGQSFRKAWRGLFDRRLGNDIRDELIWVSLLMILWLILSLLGNVLFIRYTCACMGFVVAIAVVSGRFRRRDPAPKNY